MNVIVDVRGMNVNIRVGDELTEDFCEQSGDREFPKVNLLSAKGALPYQPGATPQDAEDQKAEALKARFISGVSSVIIRACPNRSVKSSSTSFLAPRIASPGSIQACDHACMLILPLSAVALVPKSSALAAWLITFTLSQRCRELSRRLK